MQRPEEPSEWAGIPSEPERALSDAERLREGADVDPGLPDLLGGSGGIESVSIPVEPVPDEAGSDSD